MIGPGSVKNGRPKRHIFASTSQLGQCLHGRCLTECNLHFLIGVRYNLLTLLNIKANFMAFMLFWLCSIFHALDSKKEREL